VFLSALYDRKTAWAIITKVGRDIVRGQHARRGLHLDTTARFYRAMHCSAKRGLAIACRLSVRLSVCPSVCDVGGS